MDTSLDNFLKETSQRIDPAIEEVLSFNLNPARAEMVLYQIRTGGKRLRPAIAAASCFLFGGKWEDIIYPAAGLEILHNYTLIVDDIIDRSQMRRGMETTWKKYGESLAQCTGMHYAASLMQAAQRSAQPEKTGEWMARTLKIVIEGEIKDILADACLKEDTPYLQENQFSEVDFKVYQEMVAGKTAALLSLSARLGAIAAGASEQEEENISEYGFNLGMAFQISDDILDLFGQEDQFGKEVYKDIKEGKRGNAVIFYALSEMKEADKARLLEILACPEKTKDEIREAVQMIKNTQAREVALEKGGEFVALARKPLELLPSNEWNDWLEGLADLIMNRAR